MRNDTQKKKKKNQKPKKLYPRWDQLDSRVIKLDARRRM